MLRKVLLLAEAAICLKMDPPSTRFGQSTVRIDPPSIDHHSGTGSVELVDPDLNSAAELQSRYSHALDDAANEDGGAASGLVNALSNPADPPSNNENPLATPGAETAETGAASASVGATSWAEVGVASAPSTPIGANPPIYNPPHLQNAAGGGSQGNLQDNLSPEDVANMQQTFTTALNDATAPVNLDRNGNPM